MKNCPLSKSEMRFIAIHCCNYTHKEILMSLNKVRKAAKIAPATKSMVTNFVQKHLLSGGAAATVASSESSRQRVPQREKGRPTKRELSEAVDLLYADCSEVDALSPDRTILDEPAVPPVKPRLEDSVRKEEDGKKDN